MDLSGHQQFRRGSMDPNGRARLGETLLAAGWAALASARAEALEIRLRNGARVSGVLALRIDGALVEAATLRGQWTHYFAVADVAMVQVIPRGGRHRG